MQQTHAHLRIGSSPHTRGTLRFPRAIGAMRRFIPAYAGNATYRVSTAWHCAVHPRIRGEREQREGLGIKTIGSSPHTRGTRYLSIGGWYGLRFIPAYAGNATIVGLNRREIPVHPRIRGERLFVERLELFRNGSSPHTRGTPVHLIVGFAVPRFIPAYAGNASR